MERRAKQNNALQSIRIVLEAWLHTECVKCISKWKQNMVDSHVGIGVDAIWRTLEVAI